jgi:hypothetical protein
MIACELSLSVETRFVLCALAIWRLTHILVAEDGPWNVVVRLRARLGDGELGRAMDCFYCASFWMAMPFAFVAEGALVRHAISWLKGMPVPPWPDFAGHVLSWILFWVALSAAASLLEQATHPGMNRPRSLQPRDGKE